VAQPKIPDASDSIIMCWSSYAVTVEAPRPSAIGQVDINIMEKVPGGCRLLPRVRSTEFDYNTVVVFCSVAFSQE
jgi:hypothetical protein